MDALLTFENSDGETIYEPFLDLPSRSEYPDYYQIIKQPISISMIQAKIGKNQYESEADLEDDVHLLCWNAQQYNEEESQIYKDAMSLQIAFENARDDRDEE